MTDRKHGSPMKHHQYATDVNGAWAVTVAVVATLGKILESLSKTRNEGGVGDGMEGTSGASDRDDCGLCIAVNGLFA